MNILITGGASGLGEAITARLASNLEDNVFFTFNTSYDQARDIENRLPNTKGIRCNFNNQSEIASLLELIVIADIDLLINNAYTSNIAPTHFHKTEYKTFTEKFEANIIPVIRITQKAILHFRGKRLGRIITILSSALVDNPPVGWSEYVAGKAYLASLCKSWATENSRFNITSNSISPSFMQTRFTENTDDRLVEDIKSSNPFKQILSTNEVSEAVHFLSRCSKQINGINLIINAGSHVI